MYKVHKTNKQITSSPKIQPAYRTSCRRETYRIRACPKTVCRCQLPVGFDCSCEKISYMRSWSEGGVLWNRPILGLDATYHTYLLSLTCLLCHISFLSPRIFLWSLLLYHYGYNLICSYAHMPICSYTHMFIEFRLQAKPSILYVGFVLLAAPKTDDGY